MSITEAYDFSGGWIGIANESLRSRPIQCSIFCLNSGWVLILKEKGDRQAQIQEVRAGPGSLLSPTVIGMRRTVCEGWG